MELGATVWTQGILVHKDAPNGYLGPFTKGRFDGFVGDVLAHVWFGDKIGYLDVPTNKISEDNGR